MEVDSRLIVWRIGPTGATGPKGDIGAGSVWYSGNGIPSDGIGVDSDYYLDVLTGDVYTKTLGSWGSPVGNLTGPQGDPGFDNFQYSGSDIEPITIPIFLSDDAGNLMPSIDGYEDNFFEIISNEIVPKI